MRAENRRRWRGRGGGGAALAAVAAAWLSARCLEDGAPRWGVTARRWFGGNDDIELVDTNLPLVSRTVDGAGVVIAFNSNRSDEDGEEVRKDHNHADPLV